VPVRKEKHLTEKGAQGSKMIILRQQGLEREEWYVKISQREGSVPFKRNFLL